MKKSKRRMAWNPIEVVTEGHVVKGSYSIETKSDWLTVRLDGGGEKSTHAGPAAAAVARLLLLELAAEALGENRPPTSLV
jgi:hypothetical protein